MSIDSSYIPELTTLDAIEELEQAYLDAHGCRTINVSHWDPSETFKNQIKGHLDIPLTWPTIDYLFSYTTGVSVGASNGIPKSLGFSPSENGLLITPSGSVSIVCAVNWLAAMGMSQLVVLFPAYFSLLYMCKRYKVEVVEKYMRRTADGYALPEISDGDAKKPRAIWITNPVYSTGVYLSDSDVQKLRDLMDDGWHVIADECLAIPGRELSHQLSDHPRFIGIYTPHKVICVNAVKFSAIGFDIQYQKFFNHWADVLYGCLGTSTRAGIAHFLSPNFPEYQVRFLARVDEARDFVAKICGRYPNVELDATSLGHFATCYFPALPSRLGDDIAFLRETVQATGGSFIPGNRNHFDPAFGFNFRINFSQDSALFRGTLVRLIDHVRSHVHA